MPRIARSSAISQVTWCGCLVRKNQPRDLVVRRATRRSWTFRFCASAMARQAAALPRRRPQPLLIVTDTLEMSVPVGLMVIDCLPPRAAMPMRAVKPTPAT